jgi:hypothetical protein
MVPTLHSMNDSEALYRNWLDWVTVNLGRDTRLAQIAATAAADAAKLGRGFNSAADAARVAWTDAAKRYSNDRRWWWDGQHWTPASQSMPPLADVAPPAGTMASAIPTKDHGWERLAVIAWIPLAAAWLWPIATVVLVAQFDRGMAFLGVVAVPAFTVIAVALGHSARANIKGTRRRGGSVAMVALMLSYLTLIGSPIWMIGFFLVGIDFTIPFGT